MIKGIILAAGRGSRMGTLTDNQPKCMLKLGKKTLFERQVDNLLRGGCEQVGVVTGYKSELFSMYDFKRFHNESWQSSNMVFSLLQADNWLTSGTCIISYSDIFYTAETVHNLLNTPSDFVITYDPDWYTLWKIRFKSPLDDAESFKINGSNELVDIGMPIQHENEAMGQYMGLIKMVPDAWAGIKKILFNLDQAKVKKIDMTSLLNLAIKDGCKIYAVPCVGAWGEVDSESDLVCYKNKLEYLL